MISGVKKIIRVKGKELEKGKEDYKLFFENLIYWI